MTSHKIKSIRIDGGFLNGVSIHFDAHLNCLIGGRGTGKTTVIEFIRYALDLMPDPKTDQKKYREFDKLIQSNLGDRTVEVEVETDKGKKYSFHRRGGEESATVKDEHGEIKDFDFRSSRIFDADIYSQNDIEEAATNPLSLLRIVDKFREEDIARIGREILEQRHKLNQIAVNLLDAKHQLSGLHVDESEIAGVVERLRTVEFNADEEPADVQKYSKSIQSVELEHKALGKISAGLSRSNNDLLTWLQGVESLITSTLSSTLLTGPNRNILNEFQKTFDSSLADIRGDIETISNTVSALHQETDRASQNIATQIETLNGEYQEVLAKHEEFRGKAEERDRLQRYHTQLVEKQDLHIRLKSDETRLTGERRILLSHLSDLYERRYEVRQNVARELNDRLNPMIRVRIIPMENTDDYKNLLLEFMKGSQMQYAQVVDKISRTIPPMELSRLVQNSLVAELSDKLDIDPARATKIIAQLQNTRDIFELEMVELYDEPLIELKDGDTYKAAKNLSTGQRCTTILPILLLESAKPLIIDQPEDNLDNAFVYSTVVPRILSRKTDRQLIFVTHNPNIPVLGDAEKVFVMSSDGRQGVVMAQGNVDKVKAEIETLLEGGKEAFEERRKRYGR